MPGRLVCAISAAIIDLERGRSQIYDSVSGVGGMEGLPTSRRAIDRAVTGQDDRLSNAAA